MHLPQHPVISLQRYTAHPPDCDQCKAGYFGTNCTLTCSACNGTCNDGPAGNCVCDNPEFRAPSFDGIGYRLTIADISEGTKHNLSISAGSVAVGLVDYQDLESCTIEADAGTIGPYESFWITQTSSAAVWGGPCKTGATNVFDESAQRNFFNIAFQSTMDCAVDIP